MVFEVIITLCRVHFTFMYILIYVCFYFPCSHCRQLIEDTARAAKAEVIPMSNVSEENVSKLKITACDRLLESRVDAKLTAGRVKNDIMSRITVVQPKPRDELVREAFIPDSVRTQQNPDGTKMILDKDDPAAQTARQTEKDLMWSHGGPGVYACDYRKYYLLEEDEWKYDAIPTMMDGKNVLDYFDEDIESKLRELEEEEAALEKSGIYCTLVYI